MRQIRLQPLGARPVSPRDRQEQRGVGVNLSSRGLCLLLEKPPALGQVFKIWVPTPLPGLDTPTLAQVRWKRHLRSKPVDIYSVGVEFLL